MKGPRPYKDKSGRIVMPSPGGAVIENWPYPEVSSEEMKAAGLTWEPPAELRSSKPPVKDKPVFTELHGDDPPEDKASE